MNVITNMDPILFFDEIKSNSATTVGDQCLISGDELEPQCITLECSHKFNYVNIYREAINQKKKNRYDNCTLKPYQLRCPYCRKVQNSILPYRENIGEKIHGINYPLKYCMKHLQCTYIFKRGPRKNQQCNTNCNSEFCSVHKKYSKKMTNYV